jgi:phosphatidylglycerol lysyltransferase
MKKFMRKLRPLLGFVLFLLALFLIHDAIKKYHYHEVVQQLFQVTHSSLLLGLALTILSYLLLTLYDLLALRYIKHPLAYKKIALASFIGYVFSYNLTIFGGSVARYRIYSSWGVSAIDTAKVVVFCGLTLWLGFFALSGVVFVFDPFDVPEFLHFFFTSTRPVGATFLVLIAGYTILAGLRKRAVKIYGLEFPTLGLGLTLVQIIIASLDWALAGSVLYVLLPSTSAVSYSEFLGIFMLAQFAGLVSQIPGGLGAFETVALLLLSPFYSAPVVLGTLLVYRAIYYLFPFTIAACLLIIHELLEKKQAIKLFGTALGQLTSAAVPHVFAVIVFLGGAILLFSGALPAEKGRLALLRDFLPLPLMEVSHFLASLIGFGLLVLARGLQRRLDAAYYSTAILLVFGIILSLFKGLDYEESTILLVMFAIFLPCRREFRRKSSLLSQPFTFAWVVTIIIVLLSSIWLGFFSYKHVEYSNSLWWQFTYRGDAPRFLRATAGVLTFSVIVAVIMLLRPVRKPFKFEQTKDWRRIKPIVVNFSRTYANLALLGDKTFLVSQSGTAFIMYGVKGQSWIAMGDPVGPKQQWEELIWRFYETSDRHGCFTVFYEVEANNLPYYAGLGLTSLKIGEEASIALKGFSLEGSKYRHLRYTVRKLENLGFDFKVLSVNEAASSMTSFRDISNAWLQHKNTREKGFSLGFFNEEYLKNFPAGTVYKEGKLVAFTNLWCGADKEELSIDLMRYLPNSHDGLMDYLFVQLMLWGRREGYRQLNLGMAPLSGLEDKNTTMLWPKFGDFIFRHGEHFYNFQGLRKYKEKFEPEWRPKYLVCPGGLAVPRVLTDVLSLTSSGIKGFLSK